MMKILRTCVPSVLLLALGAGITLHAQTNPAVPNGWDNPDFRDRVLGSYGVMSDVEPEALSRDEARFFNENIIPLVEADDFRGAIQQLQANITPESNANLVFVLGTLYLQNNDLTNAARNYRIAIERHPTFLRAYKNLGIIFSQQNDYENAITYLTKSIELGDNSGDTYGLLGYNYFNLGRYLAAVDAYRLASTLNPKNTDWLVGKTQSLMEIKDYDEAEQAALELLKLDPTNFRYWLTRANADIGQEQFESAITNLELAIRLGKPPVRSYMLLGDLYLREGIPQLGLKVYLDALGKGLDDKDVLRVGQTLVSQGLMDEAATFLADYEEGKSIPKDSTGQQLRTLKARIALDRGQDDEAAEILLELVELDPTNGRAVLQLARYYQGQNDFETAVYYFELAAAVGNTGIKFDALVQNAVYLVDRKDFKGARELLRQALSYREERRIVDYLEAVERIIESQR